MKKLACAVIAFFLSLLALVACGGDRFSAVDKPAQDASTDPILEAGHDAVHETKPEADAVADNVLPEAETSVPEAGEDVVAETEPVDAATDPAEEPAASFCSQNGEDGKIMVYGSAVINPSKYLTIFGSVIFPANDAGIQDTGWKGWCWSDQGVGNVICFPKLANSDLAPALPGTVVEFQPGMTDTDGATPSVILCQFGKCSTGTYSVCAGFQEVCHVTGGILSGPAIYVDPNSDGKVNIRCTL